MHWSVMVMLPQPVDLCNIYPHIIQGSLTGIVTVIHLLSARINIFIYRCEFDLCCLKNNDVFKQYLFISVSRDLQSGWYPPAELLIAKREVG